MEVTFYRGNFRKDSRQGVNRGWIVGSFIEDGPRRTEDVEIKYWEYHPGPTGHGRKVSGIIEVTFILKGKTLAEIGDERLVLEAGDYVVIPPNTPNNTVLDILEDAAGLTVKAPSDISAKNVIP
jgi:quercetin dioxygenase-like cupin family protein